ncbi:MAG: hypothetical protein IJS31_04860 [Oscillospiraceae bacterium]|nr:hypothetical protein [Oscillospiraceae bacterium]
MKLSFVTPRQPLDGIEFGAASFGMVGCEDPTAANLRTFAKDLRGTVIHGSYRHCLENLPKKAPQAIIALLGNAGGENAFIGEVSRRMGCPITGGAAAFEDRMGLIAGGGEASLFCIDDDRYEIAVSCRNIHTEVLEQCVLELEDARTIRTVNGEDAVAWYNQKRAQLDLAPDDFEHLTISDEDGINAHMSIANGKLISGRDLHTRMLLRYANPNDVQKQMQAFYEDADSLVFGCAGLKKILPAPLHTDGLGLFMFGEVCTVNGKADFGNLMLSKLTVR